MYARVRFLLALFCFLEVVSHGSSQTTSDDGMSTSIRMSTAMTSGMTVAAPTTASPYSDWEIICNGTLCSYKLHAPASEPDDLNSFIGNISSANTSLQQFQEQYQIDADLQNKVTLLIEHLKEIKQNLSSALNLTQDKLNKTRDEFDGLHKSISDTQCSIAQAAAFIPCYATCNNPMSNSTNSSCSKTTTSPPTTQATTSRPTTQATTTAGLQTTTTTQQLTTIGTSPTPRPTPPNPCANKTCAGALGYNGTCSYANNVATCQCPGNLDPDSCGKVGCVSRENGGQLVNQLGPFWSPGYNGSAGTYSGNLACLWTMRPPQSGWFINITLLAFKTEKDATLTITGKSGNTQLSGDLTLYLNPIFNQRVQDAIVNSTSVLLEFTSTNPGTKGDYFSLDFSFFSPPTI